MANFEIKSPAEFSTQIRKLETTDKGHPDSFNPQFEALLNNDVYLEKKLADMQTIPEGVIFTGEAGEETTEIPRDTDLLGGQKPEYYAKAETVQAIKEKTDKISCTKTNVTPESSGFSTLREYLLSLFGQGVTSGCFYTVGFPDLPNGEMGWGYDIEFQNAGGQVIKAYRQLAADGI